MTSKADAFPTSDLCQYSTDAVYYRDRDLVNDLLGKASFVEVFIYQMLGREASPAELTIYEAVLVALMEHGLTPSAIAARMVYSSSPENLQSGVAAGLLAVGSRFVGTMEDCALLLEDLAAAPDLQARSGEVARAYRSTKRPVPGFGHHLHRPDDPRAFRLLALAREQGTFGPRCEALLALSKSIDGAAGRHITINATGAIAAVLADTGIPARLMRAFAVLSRAAGLISHIAEEQKHPADRHIWSLIDGKMSRPGARSNKLP